MSQIVAAASAAANTPTTPTRLRLNRAKLMANEPVYTGRVCHLDAQTAGTVPAGRVRRRGRSSRIGPCSSSRRCASAASASGSTLSMTGRNVPSKSSCAASLELGETAHVRTEQRQLAREQVPQVDRGVWPGGRAAGDQAAAGGERAHAAVPGRLADVLDDDVRAAAVGEPRERLAEKSPAVVIEHVRRRRARACDRLSRARRWRSTRAPKWRASWIAAWPTPLPPASTSTTSRPRCNARVSAACATRSGTSAETRPPSTKSTWSGIGIRFSTGTATSSA